MDGSGPPRCRRLHPDGHSAILRITQDDVRGGGSVYWKNLRRGIVSGAEEGSERRQSSRRRQLDLDIAVFSIACCVTGIVSEQVLVSQLDADFGRQVRQL